MTREIDKELDGIKRISLLSSVATLHKSRGSFELAEELFSRNLNEIKTKLGFSDHPEVWHFMNSFAIFYTKANRFEQAEAIHLEIIAYREANGMEHDLATLTTKSNLASLYYMQGRFELAQLYYRTCLLGRKQVLGDSAKETLEISNNLALTLVEIAKNSKNFLLFDEAEELYLNTLALRKVIFGSDHKLVIETQNDLGNLYYLKNDLDKAEILFAEIYENSNNLIDENPRRYLKILNNYANTYFLKGKLEQALNLFQTAHQLYITKFGDDDHDTLISMHNLGSILFSMDKFDESIEILVPCLEKRKNILGLSSQSTLTTMNLLGLVYCAKEQYFLAEPLLKFVLENKKEDIVVRHPNNNSSPKNSNSHSPTSNHSPISPSSQKSSPTSKSPRKKNYSPKGMHVKSVK